jgi:hypothetical protein
LQQQKQTRWFALVAYIEQAVSGHAALSLSTVRFTGVVLSSRHTAVGFIEDGRR